MRAGTVQSPSRGEARLTSGPFRQRKCRPALELSLPSSRRRGAAGTPAAAARCRGHLLPCTERPQPPAPQAESKHTAELRTQVPADSSAQHCGRRQPCDVRQLSAGSVLHQRCQLTKLLTPDRNSSCTRAPGICARRAGQAHHIGVSRADCGRDASCGWDRRGGRQQRKKSKEYEGRR